MKGINLCGECGSYDWKKHRCKRGATKDTHPAGSFYADCPLDDVEPVVRCKDCKYARPLNRDDPVEDAFIMECIWCWKRQDGVLPDEFCSDGKRRGENV